MSDPQDKSAPKSSGNGETRVPYNGQPDDLHDLFAVAAADEEDPLAALRDDPNYAALIRDLETIAAAARDLFKPAEEAPSDDLWDKIASQLPAKPSA